MRRLRRPVDPANYPELSKVLTCAATAVHFQVDRKTVENAINDGRVAALQVGGIWLVSKRSASKLWGNRRLKATRKSGSINRKTPIR